MVVSLKGERNIMSELLWNTLQIRGLGDGIWFVAALFMAFIPFYFIIKWDEPKKACVISMLLSIVSVIYTHIMNPDLLPWNSTALPWHIEYIFQAMFWMVLGYYFKRYGEVIFDKLNTAVNRCVVWLLYLIIVYIPEDVAGDYAILLSYIKSILGILSIIALCKIFKSNRYVNFVGKNTLIYFALHGKVYSVIEKMLEKVVGSFYEMCLSNSFYSSVLAVLITFILSVMLIIPAMVINRWFPWMLGRKIIKRG